MSGLVESSAHRAALIVGIHQTERDYGQNVACNMNNARIEVVRVDQGLPQPREFNGSSFYYTTYLRELYLQLHQQVAGRFQLVIDLHTGINETGRCADIFSSDIRLLDTVHELLQSHSENVYVNDELIRLVRITEKNASLRQNENSYPVSYTIIPERVWKAEQYYYVGLEIYLLEPGSGQKADWKYGIGLIDIIFNAMELMRVAVYG